jgi:acetyl esterase/lipase
LPVLKKSNEFFSQIFHPESSLAISQKTYDFGIMSIYLTFQTYLIRLITGAFAYLDTFSAPHPPDPKLTIKIPSSSSVPGSFNISIYKPSSPSPYPTIINFHGGGFIFGSSKLDARWAAKVVEAKIAVVSVNYRLAPEYPYPTPVDDCEDAVHWFQKHAKEYGLDASKVVLTGFSAGANMALAIAYRLRAQGIKLDGVLSFYPLVDRTRSREEKLAGNPIAGEKMTIPKYWQKVFDDAYLQNAVDLSSPDLSPGLATDDMVRGLPRVGLWSCEWDELLEETETFRRRLAMHNVKVDGYTIKEVPHAWDKSPQKDGGVKRDAMYSSAVGLLREIFNIS